MAESPNSLVDRKLSAILAADIAGYSGMVARDEVGTVRALKSLQGLVLPMIPRFGGRVIDTAGDGILAEFASIVNAVQCAIAIQQATEKRNHNPDTLKKMHWRIGVNFGDVIFDRARVYGDGVNIAARLESVAELGSVCLSAKVHEEIKGKIEAAFIDLGALTLKNIPQPIHVYRLDTQQIMDMEDVLIPARPLKGPSHNPSSARLFVIASAILLMSSAIGLFVWNGVWRSKEGLTPIAPRLSILVLPLLNLSEDKSQDYIADGITEDVTNSLSRISGAFVLARNTAFTFKGKAVDVKALSRDLGVRYVLEGSVRKIEDTVRLSVQLIDAATGSNVWSERIDTAKVELDRLEDTIPQRIARSLGLKLVEAESRRLDEKKVAAADAVDLTLRGREYLNRPRTKASLDEALSYFEKALILDPLFPTALIGASRALGNLVTGRWTADVQSTTRRALALAMKAVEVAGHDADAHLAHCEALRANKDHEDSILACKRALALNPNLSPAYTSLALATIFAGRSNEMFGYIDMALRLSPLDPQLHYFYALKGHAYAHLGNYEEAIVWATKAVTLQPFWVAYIDLIAAYGWLNRRDEAALAIGELDKLMPGFTVAKWINGGWSNNKVFISQLQLIGEGLRRAGMPD